MIHRQSNFVVVTGPDAFPQWMETEDRIFYDPATFHSSQTISHKTEVSISLSLLSLLFFLLFFACLFRFFVFLTISLSAFWLRTFVLLISRRPDDLSPLLASGQKLV